MSGKGFKKFANGIGEEITNVDVDQKRKTSKIPKLHLSFLPNSKSPKKEGGFSFFKWNNKKIDTKSTDVDVPNESQEEIISQNDESMRVSKEESLVEDNDSKRSSPFKQTLDNNEFQNVNNRVETSQVSVRSSSDAGVISSLLRGSGKLRTSPAQDYISSLGSRIGAQVIAGFKGPERRPSTDMNVSQHGEESFNTSQWSSPRFDSPRLDSPRFDYSTDASIHDANDNVRYNIPEETSKTSKSDWFSPIRSLLKKKEKQPSDPTNQQSDSRHRPVPVSSLHGANHQLDDRPHYLGSDHVDDKNMQKHRGYLAWNSLIALGFGLYLGVSILVTAQKWLFIELGINDKGQSIF